MQDNSSHKRGQVVSSHGTATIDLDTGEVISAQIDRGGDPSTFTDVKRFDIKEYRAFYGPEVDNDDHFDILDLGYWDNEGNYEPADAWFRQDVFRNQRDSALRVLKNLLSALNHDSDGDYFICAEAKQYVADAEALLDLYKRP